MVRILYRVAAPDDRSIINVYLGLNAQDIHARAKALIINQRVGRVREAAYNDGAQSSFPFSSSFRD